MEYDLGEKGSTDWVNGKEEWDCVSFAEAAYEHADLNPTPDSYEGTISSCDVYLRPQEQFNFIDKPPPGAGQDKAVAVSVKSPVSLHLYDSQGNHVGLNTEGVLDSNIFNVYYYEELEEYPQAILILDAKEQYALKIEALDEGSFDLHVSDLNLWNSGKMTEVEFQDVPIKKETLANLKLGSAGNDFVMGIDENGDGKEDRTLEPTSIEAGNTASTTTKSQSEERYTETWTVMTGETTALTENHVGSNEWLQVEGIWPILVVVVVAVVTLLFLIRRRRAHPMAPVRRRGDEPAPTMPEEIP